MQPNHYFVPLALQALAFLWIVLREGRQESPSDKK